MVNKETIIRKLSRLKGYLQELNTFQSLTWDDYISSFQNRRTVERLIQLIVDVAVDINMHAVVDEGRTPPSDAYNSFIDGSRVGLIPMDFAQQIAPSTGERNIIVHEYELIDDALVYQSIGETLLLYEQYIKHVLAYLDKL